MDKADLCVGGVADMQGCVVLLDAKLVQDNDPSYPKISDKM